MLSEENIYAEIRKFVSDLVDAGAVTPVEWITQDFLNSRNDISGSDAALYRACTRAHIARIVKKVVGKYDTEARAIQEPGLSLEGFEHLQRAYTITRDEKVVLVPVHKCTDSELTARAEEYDRMAVGCRVHAREIRAFVASRVAAPQEAA